MENFNDEFDHSLVFRGKRFIPNPPEFEDAEHGFLGDNIMLTLESGDQMYANKVPFDLPNKLRLTYGEINGLAGDFYGTTEPISDGITSADRARRFLKAWAQLAEDVKSQPKEAQAILALLKEEAEKVNDYIIANKDPSEAYGTEIEDITSRLQILTITRGTDYPSYLGLARINWDHFGEYARITYNTGHGVALEYAATPGSNLFLAYARNAFADHFLEDCFSAGHLRAPRHVLHNLEGTADLCCKYMHDEDCALGISAKNPNGDSFMVYGDKRLLDKVNIQNKDLCRKAIEVSAHEVYQAWREKKIPPESSYEAWKYAPTLESSRGEQALAPLFKFPSNGSNVAPRRSDIKKRKQTADTNYTEDYWYATTMYLIQNSGLWKYPMSLGN